MLLIAEDWYFLSHRRALAEALRAAGWQVVIATHVTDHGDEIRRAGFDLEPIPLERRGTNPLRELASILAILRLLRRHRPDILHCVALKPVLYGNLAAILAGQRLTVNALAGLGYAFTGRSAAVRALRAAVEMALRLLLRRRRSRVIVQNDDDRALLLDRGIATAEQISLIRGSGVDLVALPALPAPEEQPVTFALVARMLADKGVAEAVEAARRLRRQGVALRLWLVGGTDPHNPTSFSATQLAAWQAEGAAEWLGHQTDIGAIWRQADVAVLPSYREGMPKALLEAAACARPIITTDVPGCRDVIEDGVEGFLVPARSADGLEAAMRKLIENADLRHRMGLAARARAEIRFAEETVIAAHLDLYARALGEIHVVHLITDLQRGGAERMLQRLVSHREAALRHTVISLQDEGAYGPAMRDAGVAVHCLGMRPGLPSPAALWQLIGLLRRLRPDVLQTWLYHADLMGSIAGRLAGIRAIVWNIRCSAMEMAAYGRSTAWVLRTLVRLSRWPVLVVANSRAGIADHRNLGYRPRQWGYIPNGFDLTEWRPDAAARTELRVLLGVPADRLLVGMVARLDPQKDHATFLVAAAAVALARPDVAFVLIGRGVTPRMPPFVRALAEPPLHDRLHFLGENESVERLMPGLDLLALTSAWGEGFPNVVGEAMACGVPCVVTQVGDAASIVGEAGLSVPVGDADGLASAILQLLALDEAARHRLGAAARARIGANYSIEAVAAQYAGLYRHLATGEGGRAPCAV